MTEKRVPSIPGAGAGKASIGRVPWAGLFALLILGLPGAAMSQVYLNGNMTAMLETGQVWPFHYAACEAGYQNSTSTSTTAAEQNQFTLSTPYSTTGATYQAFWSGDSSCSAPDGGSTTLPMTLGILGTSPAEVASVDLESLLVSVTGLSDPCDAQPPTSGTGYVCITETSYSYYGSIPVQPFYLTIQYDMSPPAQPTGFAVTPADSELDLTWNFPYDSSNSAGKNADHFLVYYQKDPILTPDAFGDCSAPVGTDAGTADAGSGLADGGVDAGAADGGYGSSTPSSSSSSGLDAVTWPNPVSVPNPNSNGLSYPLTGLKNGICYDVSVAAIYPDGTQGYAAPVITRAPIEIFDYWRLYHSAGGSDSGGFHCQAASGGLVPLAMVLAVLLLLRARRRRPQ